MTCCYLFKTIHIFYWTTFTKYFIRFARSKMRWNKIGGIEMKTDRVSPAIRASNFQWSGFHLFLSLSPSQLRSPGSRALSAPVTLSALSPPLFLPPSSPHSFYALLFNQIHRGNSAWGYTVCSSNWSLDDRNLHRLWWTWNDTFLNLRFIELFVRLCLYTHH